MAARAEGDVLASLAPVRVVASREVRREMARERRLVVVLDDDPTGTQTVADVPVLTTWSIDDHRWAMRQGSATYVVVTNSRSLDPAHARTRVAEVVENLTLASRLEGVEVVVTARGDSTLRGHFPLETDVIAQGLARAHARPCDGVVLVPAYVEAGRVTVDSLHLVRTSEGFVPVGESEFARDDTFAYAASDLRDYVDEKSRGRWPAAEVARITLDDLRRGGPTRVAQILGALRGGRPVVVDAVCDDDLRVLVLGLLDAERAGRHFVYRAGPSFVRARAGLDATAPLDSSQIRALRERTSPAANAPPRVAHGLVLVGSHVTTSTRQLELLVGREGVSALELDVPALLRESTREVVVDTVARAVIARLAVADVVVATSRDVARGVDGAQSLAMARTVSWGLAEIVRRVVAASTPSWIVAKGGITSSDVATEGLGIRRAWARGTLLAGIISLWEPVVEGAASIPYVVFAGNVGDEGALVAVVEILRGSV